MHIPWASQTCHSLEHEQVMLVCGEKSLFHIVKLYPLCSPMDSGEAWLGSAAFPLNLQDWVRRPREMGLPALPTMSNLREGLDWWLAWQTKVKGFPSCQRGLTSVCHSHPVSPAGHSLGCTQAFVWWISSFFMYQKDSVHSWAFVKLWVKPLTVCMFWKGVQFWFIPGHIHWMLITWQHVWQAWATQIFPLSSQLAL